MNATDTATFTVKDLMDRACDAYLSEGSITIGKLADVLHASPDLVVKACDVLADNAIVEVQKIGTDPRANVITVESLDTCSRKTLYARIVALGKQQAATRIATSATSDTTPRTRVSRPSAPSVTPSATPSLLTERKIDKSHVAVYVTSKMHVYQTEAVSSHRNERITGTDCIVCGRPFGHVRCGICSPDYNLFRDPAKAALARANVDAFGKSVAYAIAMGYLQGEELERAIEAVRVKRDVAVKVLSLKSAARMIEELAKQAS